MAKRARTTRTSRAAKRRPAARKRTRPEARAKKPGAENAGLKRKLAESVAQQAATADILKVIASSPSDVGPVLQAIVESARELCEASDAVVLLRDSDNLRFSEHAGPVAINLDKWPIGRGWTAGRAYLDQKPVHVHDMQSEEGAEFPDAKVLGQSTGSTIHTVLSVPLLRGKESIGAILLRRTEVRPFSDKQINLLSTFADQAVIAIQNARLFGEVQTRTRDLEEALERQTATADVLGLINSSRGDLAPVFDAILQKAHALCGVANGSLQLCDDEYVRAVAIHGVSERLANILRERRRIAESPNIKGLLAGQRYVQINDARETNAAILRAAAELDSARTLLCVPLRKEGRLLGMIVAARHEVKPFTAKEIGLLENFAAQAAIAIENVRLFDQVQAQTRELSQSLDDLRTAQDRLVQTEKLASLGQLTAGIAHEIKNPLNFVNNFSALSGELIEEMKDVLSATSLDNSRREELDEITQMLKSNLEKVVQHGKRADSIVKNMLLHSRQGSGEHRPVDINAIVDESLNLAYHGARAERTDFNITMQRNFDPSVGLADVYPQEITRVLLNLISNGFYATTKRKTEAGDGFEPTLSAATKNLGDKVEIRIRDNGTGVPEEVKEKIFNPFFTTKPAGEGTGLGLSMSHDIIVKQHGGTIDVDTAPGIFTEFRIVLPRAGSSVIKSGEQP